MRIHSLAMMALLTAAVGTGCDSAREVSDNGRVNAYGCDQCHGYPPPPSFTDEIHPAGVTASSCALCHPTTVLEDGHTIAATGAHRNGQIEVATDWQTPPCTACHGTPPGTGMHVFHMTVAEFQDAPLTCATCHDGYALGDAGVRTANADLHMNGSADVELADGTIIPSANQPDGSWTDAQCRACHDVFDADD